MEYRELSAGKAAPWREKLPKNGCWRGDAISHVPLWSLFCCHTFDQQIQAIIKATCTNMAGKFCSVAILYMSVLLPSLSQCEKVLGVSTDDFDFDGLPGVQHEFKVNVYAGKEQCFFQAIKQGAQLHVSFEVGSISTKTPQKIIDFAFWFCLSLVYTCTTSKMMRGNLETENADVSDTESVINFQLLILGSWHRDTIAIILNSCLHEKENQHQ